MIRAPKSLQRILPPAAGAVLEPDLTPLGRQIIECCLNGGSVDDYQALIDHPTIVDEDWN